MCCSSIFGLIFLVLVATVSTFPQTDLAAPPAPSDSTPTGALASAPDVPHAEDGAGSGSTVGIEADPKKENVKSTHLEIGKGSNIYMIQQVENRRKSSLRNGGNTNVETDMTHIRESVGRARGQVVEDDDVEPEEEPIVVPARGRGRGGYVPRDGVEDGRRRGGGGMRPGRFFDDERRDGGARRGDRKFSGRGRGRDQYEDDDGEMLADREVRVGGAKDTGNGGAGGGGLLGGILG